MKTKRIPVPDEVRDVLREADVTADRVVLPPRQLPRPLYTAVDKVLKAAGGKWNRKAAAHVFSLDPREALGLAVETGEVVHRQKTLQAFYTPPALADQVAEQLSLAGSMRLLEPSAGQGALIEAVRRREHTLGLIRVAVVAVDVDPATTADLSLAIATYPDRYGPVETRCANFLDIEQGEIGTFDRVAMNPPFSDGAAARHIGHAYRMLRHGGVLVAVAPANILEKDHPAHRDLLAVLGRSAVVREMQVEDAGFADTKVRVCLLRIERARRG